MNLKFKRTAAFLLSLLLLAPMGASVYSEDAADDAAASQEQTEDADEKADEAVSFRPAQKPRTGKTDPRISSPKSDGGATDLPRS